MWRRRLIYLHLLSRQIIKSTWAGCEAGLQLTPAESRDRTSSIGPRWTSTLTATPWTPLGHVLRFLTELDRRLTVWITSKKVFAWKMTLTINQWSKSWLILSYFYCSCSSFLLIFLRPGRLDARWHCVSVMFADVSLGPCCGCVLVRFRRRGDRAFSVGTVQPATSAIK